MVDSSGVPRIDGVEILEEVGQGGFATVYRGHQSAFHRDVAVKVLQQSRLDSEDRRRFERECQAMGALSGHPFIVTLYDAGFTTDEHPYLIMPYVADGTLHDRLASGPMPWQEVLTLGVHLAGALETAHRAGVIHRDIKPGNVLRSEYGNQLSDFGIARLQGGHETRSGVITASISHAPPEILDGQAPSEQSDVYSLGSTLFQAITGRSAFERTADETLISVVRRVISEPVPDLRASGTPAIVATTLERAMAKEPSDRYPSAESFGHALQHAQSTVGLPPTELVIVGERREPSAGAPTIAAAAPPKSIEEPAMPPSAAQPSPTVIGPHSGGVLPDSRFPGDHLPSAPPAKPRRTKVLVPLAIGGALAAVIGVFAVWPREDTGSGPVAATVADSEPTSSNETGSTTESGPESTVAPKSVGEPAATTIGSGVAEQPGPAEALLVASVDVDATTNVDGFWFTGIDGLGYDSAGSTMLAARDSAPVDAQEPDPTISAPAVFEIPLNPVGAQSTALDFSSAAATLVLDASGEPYGPEMDIEGMVGLDDGTFYLVSEGSSESGSLGEPFVHRFDPTARFQSALSLPDWYLSNAEEQSGFTPERGLHGIDLRPGSAEQVVVAVEAPLLQDHDPDQPTESKVARLIAFDVDTGAPTAEWGYPLDLISATVASAEPTAQSLIVDIGALGDDAIVVLESTRTPAGRQVSLYRVMLDAGSAPGPGTPATIEKTPIAVSGMDSLSEFRSIAAGPTLPDGEPSLVLATDNGFDGTPTQIVVLSVDDES